MKILVKPSDLIRRLVWDKYAYFVLHKVPKSTIKTLIERDEVIELNEEDAFVIGLLNTIYTPELIYKFKQYLREILDNKSFKNKAENDRLYITKQILINHASKFLSKFPEDWRDSNQQFNNELERLENLCIQFIEDVDLLETTIIQTWPCVKYAQVKKIINKID